MHDLPVERPTPEDGLIDADERRRMGDVLAELPVSAEQALRAQLRHEAGEGPPIHEALGCSRGAARVRLSRARQALVALLQGKERS